MSEYYYLPGLLREIADVAGLPAALAIAEARGGTMTHFPARAGDAHWLRECVGHEAAEKLCAHFRTTQQGGISLLVPLGPKNFYARARRAAEEMTREGRTRQEVARALGVHIRSVQRYRRRLDDTTEDPQGSLL